MEIEPEVVEGCALACIMFLVAWPACMGICLGGEAIIAIGVCVGAGFAIGCLHGEESALVYFNDEGLMEVLVKDITPGMMV